MADNWSRVTEEFHLSVTADTPAFTARGFEARPNNATKWAAKLFIAAAVTAAAKIYLEVSNGTTTHRWALNADVALVAGALYAWDDIVVPVGNATTSYTYTVEFSTTTTAEILVVEEYVGDRS